jgi:hypothetical protein
MPPGWNPIPPRIAVLLVAVTLIVVASFVGLNKLVLRTAMDEIKRNNWRGA